jgi:hypothetical protein
MAMKLKGSDLKQLAINHGEKGGFGLVVAIVLAALFFTNWMPYKKQPSEITDKVVAAKGILDKSGWPEEERKAFELSAADEPDQVVFARLDRAITVAPNYEPSERLTRNPYSTEEPLQEPVWETVEEMIATGGRVFVELPPEDPATEDATLADGSDPKSTTAETKPADDDLPDDLRPRTAGLASALAGGPAGMSPYEGMMMDYESMYAPELEMPYATGSEMTSAEGYEGMYGGMQSNLRGKGYPFVSVRGVFPFKDQVRKFTDAIKRPYAEALRSFDIIDFQLERQELYAGQWGDWQPVDLQVFNDVILSASGIAPDVVQAAVTDSAITCPLPMRLTGVWGQQTATHPRLVNFELTGRALDYELEFNKALLKEALDQKKALPKAPVMKKGFSNLVFDTRSLQSGLMGYSSSPYELDPSMYTGSGMSGAGMSYAMSGMSSPGYGAAAMGARRSGPGTTAAKGVPATFADLVAKIEKQVDPNGADKELIEWIKARATVAGELLLFRYLDFNVEPGHTYRYRVRLEIRNPNYNKPPAMVADPSIIEKETRLTPWSEPTPPAPVPDSVNYFLTRVDPSRRLLPDARLNMYQWDTELGTTVHQELPVPLGRPVGGKAEAEQFNPAKGKVEEADYTFASGDVLVDVLPDLSFTAAEHPELQLPRGSKGNAQITEQAIVVKSDGTLGIIDPLTQSDALATAERYQKAQDEQFASLKNRAAVGEEGDLASLYEMYGMEGESSVDGGRSRSRNPLKRGGGGMGGMPGYQMPPGMSGPGMGPGRPPAKPRPGGGRGGRTPSN